MKKAIALPILISLLFTLLSLTSIGEGRSLLYDKADIIKNDEEVRAILKDFEAKCKIPLIVVTTEHDGDFSLNELGISYSTSAVILEITEDLVYSIYTYGDATEKIIDSEVDRILDAKDVYNNIKSGKLEAGISAFAKSTRAAYLGKLQEPLYVTVIISAAIALVISGIVLGVIVFRYKRKQKAPSYPLEKYASMIVEGSMCSDMFIGSSVTRTRVNTSSSGGGGGGRSGGGGGGKRGSR